MNESAEDVSQSVRGRYVTTTVLFLASLLISVLLGAVRAVRTSCTTGTLHAPTL
jgi:hypothetical protein